MKRIFVRLEIAAAQSIPVGGGWGMVRMCFF